MGHSLENLLDYQIGNNGALPHKERKVAVTVGLYMEVTGASLEVAQSQLGFKAGEENSAPIDEEGLHELYY